MELLKFGSFKKFELNMPSCRVFCGLSEYQKIIVIILTEQKLWPVKDSAIFTSDLRMYLILCTHTHTHTHTRTHTQSALPYSSCGYASRYKKSKKQISRCVGIAVSVFIVRCAPPQ